jgi:hypothetical protein
MKRNPRKTVKHYHRAIREAEYKRQVKLMRPYFGDTFKPDGGYDLRDFEDWSGAQKRKVTKYWRVMAGLVSQDHQARYYRRDDHLETAIAYTQQTELLPGQTAAVFPIPEAAKLDVEFSTTGRIKVRREGREVQKFFFDPTSLAFDPEREAKRLIAAIPENARLKLMVGSHEGRSTFDRGDLQREIHRITVGGGSDRGRKFMVEGMPHYAHWLLGAVTYERRPRKPRRTRLHRARMKS